MKLPNLDDQLQAIEAMGDLFRGREACRTEFSVTMNLPSAQAALGLAESDLGVGTRPIVTVDEPQSVDKSLVPLTSSSDKRGSISARVELHVQTANGVKAQEVVVNDGENLKQLNWLLA